jgi:hypothetical protein
MCVFGWRLLCFAVFGLAGCFVKVGCGFCWLGFLFWLEDDQGALCGSSSLSSLSLGAKGLLGLAGLRHHALMLAKK